jgi:hypothetical protein
LSILKHGSRCDLRAFKRLGFGGEWTVFVLLACVRLAWPTRAQQSPPRRFIIDSHQHWRSDVDYVDRLVGACRPVNAMACVLTPMDGFDAVRQALQIFLTC